MHWDRQSRLSTFFNSPERASPRSSSILTRSSSPSSSHSDLPATLDAHQNANPVVLGVCAMDVKARSKAMREILIRLVERARGSIEVKVFGDKVILDEDVENWPRCDILISFFSTDFPLDKAISYVKLRNPFCINDLAPQALLWDRRLVGAVLDYLKVPTPPRLEVSRDGGPKIDPELISLMKQRHGITLGGYQVTPEVTLREDGDAIIIDGKVLEKPFVEKPVSGEDHNVYIYFKGGGGRRLFRKVGNKSSDLDPTLNHPRTDGSYIYEKFIDVDNSEDIKVYTVGKEYTHAETRKSPVVDGVVRRNTEGKEIRFITRLTEEERAWATKICEGFGQRVCGFDMLRCNNGKKSQVIDVNGWSFVKGNNTYYGTAFLFRGLSVSAHRGNVSWSIRSSEAMKLSCAERPDRCDMTFRDKAADILAALCMRLSSSPDRALPGAENMSVETPTWLLKANVTVYRHADRTPKQKLKFNFPIGEPWTQPFVTLLNGEKEEIILREKDQLNLIATAVEEAKKLGADGEELNKLTQLNNALFSKIDLPGTKAQLKPVYSKRQAGHVRRLTKLTLVFKWGGEFTHSARYQSRDLGENMKKDISIMNKEVLQNVKIFTSSERRVIASAEIFAASLYDTQSPSYTMNTSSNSSSRSSTDGSTNGSGSYMNSPHPETPLTLIVRKDLLDDSNAAKDLMDDVKKRLKILLRPGESEKRPELTWPKSMKKEPVEVVKEVIELLGSFRDIMHRNFETMDVDKIQERWCCGDEPWLFRERWEKLFEDFCDVEQKKFDPSRVSELYDTIKYCALHHRTFLFAIFDENGRRDPLQPHDRKLHELYGRAKALFDLVAPQEYGIDPDEKEEIGVLTSLPLLHNVVQDLEAARNNGGSSLTLYFTKESHIHTLVNLVLLSGLPIANRRIPELDYASHITFELYERNHGRGKSDKEYSIKISLSEGAHSSNVLDSTLDARHSLNVQSRRKLTQHLPYSLVIEKLSKHFHRLSELEDEDTGPDTPFETVEALPALDSGSEDV
ncbi:related to Inositol hexakisphosphate and diphosphoinositol-pentakisphosphate kinase [Armillaria ostoyae]|uniref:Inositol hexakisphosphate and diphosphoinositol-pentakisphosphate kinase n=1 Tax=Armillaria ostoyae TaxID=47428 RepID=A0A284QZV2_ARMOS|nr:related to Inositol hexakisphosphate and diphosphoinositol-pentakisphosphate kinase [Armillaria ostoyae]